MCGNRTYTVGTAPSITIDALTDGDVINEGTPITFSATVSDAKTKRMQWHWIGLLMETAFRLRGQHPLEKQRSQTLR